MHCTDMPKSLSRGWPLCALRNQLYGNAESPVSYLDQTKVEIPNVLITGEFCNPWSTLLLQLSMHQCCIISEFESSVFNYLLQPFAWLWSINLRSSFLKCVSFRTLLNSHYYVRSQKGKGKKKRRIESLRNGQNKQEACSHSSQNYFYCRPKGSIHWLTTSI